MADRAERPADLGKWISMAKLIASDNAMKVTVEAIQVLGGYGYVNEYPVERMMRDAKISSRRLTHLPLRLLRSVAC